MKREYVMEFLGTFFLVLIVAMTENPLAIGMGLTGLVYMGGYISGAHYNPAVTICMWWIGNMKSDRAWGYMRAQMLGGLVAAMIFRLITLNFFAPQMAPQTSLLSGFVIEALMTFLLVSVILHVAVAERNKSNQFFGLAIGVTLMAIAFAGGPISGGAFNPAVGIAPLIIDVAQVGGYAQELIVYSLGPVSGGILAGWIFTMWGEK